MTTLTQASGDHYLLIYQVRKTKKLTYLTPDLSWGEIRASAATFASPTALRAWFLPFITTDEGKQVVANRPLERFLIGDRDDAGFLLPLKEEGADLSPRGQLLRLLDFTPEETTVDLAKLKAALGYLVWASGQRADLKAAVTHHDKFATVDFLHLLELNDLGNINQATFLHDFQQERRARRVVKDRYLVVNAVSQALQLDQLLALLTEAKVFADRTYSYRTKEVRTGDYLLSVIDQATQKLVRPAAVQPPKPKRKRWWRVF